MTDRPPEPFLLLTKEAENMPPRPGPTMAKILELLQQTLKRQQQTALMVDGFASAVNRRFDVLHEEMALMRVALNRPANDTDATVEVDVDTDEEEKPTPRKRRALAITGNVLSYATTAAVVLRLVGKQFPEYQEAIDGVLGMVGL